MTVPWLLRDLSGLKLLYNSSLSVQALSDLEAGETQQRNRNEGQENELISKLTQDIFMMTNRLRLQCFFDKYSILICWHH